MQKINELELSIKFTENGQWLFAVGGKEYRFRERKDAVKAAQSAVEMFKAVGGVVMDDRTIDMFNGEAKK